MKIGQTVYVIMSRRQLHGQAYFYKWQIEERQVVSHDMQTVCVCGTPSGRLAFHPATRVYENAGIATEVRDDYEKRGLTPREVFGE